MSVDLEPKLQRLVERLHGPHARLSSAERLTSGANLETWAFAARNGDEISEYILRRRAGTSGTFSIDLRTEAVILQAVARNGVLAPPFVHLCDASDDLGEAHVTRRVSGETLGRKIVADARFEIARSKLAHQCGEQFARIHATPAPRDLPIHDANAVLSHYERVYQASGAARPVLELAFRHLRSRAPTLERPSLLHGDFRNGNLIVDPQIGLAAVLDWELAHRGDPGEDLGWICVNSWRFGVTSRPVGGFGNYEDLLDGYRATGGEQMPLSRLRFWQAIGSLKWAVMCLIMYDSWATGRSTSVERPVIGRRVSEAEIDLLNLFEAGV